MLAQPRKTSSRAPSPDAPTATDIRVEQRRHNRYMTSFRVTGPGMPKGKIKGDLSIGGFGLTLPVEPEVGASSMVSLEIGALPLNVQARCAWSQLCEDGFQAGYQFVELSDTQRRQLKCFLR